MSTDNKDTIENRIKIGFPETKSDWVEAKADLTEEDLFILDQPVMSKWETSYMAALAEVATQNRGRVLELGFGMVISAGFIQNYEIEEHVIIEANKDIYSNLERFAKESKNKVTPVFGFWQQQTANLKDESFDGILFDTYPIVKEEIHKNHFSFFKEAYRLLKPQGILTYYSDEAKDFSKEHLAKIKDAGFKKIASYICPVSAPENCQYWKQETLLVPILRK